MVTVTVTTTHPTTRRRPSRTSDLVVIPAAASAIRAVRSTVDRVCAAHGLVGARRDAIMLAVTTACTHAVTAARADSTRFGRRTVEVEIARTADALEFAVEDHGLAHDAEAVPHGPRTRLLSLLADRCTFTRASGGGTRIGLTFNTADPTR